MDHIPEDKNILAIGIDISKAKLDIAFLSREGELVHLVLPNNEKHIRALVNHLIGYEGKVILESTGRYHLLCTLILSQAGLDIRVLNPLMSHKYLQGGIRKNKSDKGDAMKLCQMAFLDHELPPRFNQDQTSIAIRQKIGLLASLEKQMQTLRGIFKGYREMQKELGGSASEAEIEIEDAIAILDKARRKLEKEIECLVLSEEMQPGSHERLVSIPGVSSYGASLMLQFFDPPSSSWMKSPKQWISYAGLDITVKQSGQWKGGGKLSKRGNAYLRKRLFAMAWGAVMNHSQFKELYDQLKQSGVCHVEALLRIARKIICIAFALLKKDEYFNEQKSIFV